MTGDTFATPGKMSGRRGPTCVSVIAVAVLVARDFSLQNFPDLSGGVIIAATRLRKVRSPALPLKGDSIWHLAP
ncbi:hypothetical protein SGPA1_50451 [Streptomyces misionensis JCM 4497]